MTKTLWSVCVLVALPASLRAQSASGSGRDSAATLSTVEVKAKGVVEKSQANPTKFDLFLERRSRGVGVFLTHDQIVARNPTLTKLLLQGVPGIKVRQNGTEWTVQSQRCSGGRIPGSKMDESQQPVIFVDGMRVGGTAELDNIVPAEIEAVEVFQGATQLPAEARGRGCFAIFIWLRTVGK
jgi:hypothetical protein